MVAIRSYTDQYKTPSFYQRESAVKTPYSAILKLFKPFKTLLNAIKSRLDLRLKLSTGVSRHGWSAA